MPHPDRLPVIAIAGLGIESSTFSPARTLAPDFHPRRGEEVLSRYPFLEAGRPLRKAAEWRGALVGKALPGGMVTADAFAALSDELLDRLAGLGSLDGLWYDIHGAMSVEGVDDAEAVLLERIRHLVGPAAVISTSMDLHGNPSPHLIHLTDLITCYRMAPHEDAMETRERAARNLVAALSGKDSRPLKAWVPIPVLLTGERTSTRVEPARSVWGAVAEVEAREGILDAAIWVGYAWADEPRNHAAVVVTGSSEPAVRAGAEHLARGFWAARRKFDFVAPAGTFDECVDEALGSEARPFFISDSGDNPTAGGAGDVTWGLGRLLARPEFQRPDGPVTVYASIPSPEAVDAVVRAGIGAAVTVNAGAAVDDRYAGPLTLRGTVHSIRHGDRNAQTEVVVRAGSIFVILTRLRKPYHREEDFTNLELDPGSADLVVVKIGYLEPDLYRMAAGWRLALSPGGVDQDLVRLGHHRVHRPMHPFDTEVPDPDLKARLIPASSQPVDRLPGW